MTPPGFPQLDVQPAPSAHELAAIVAALAHAAASEAPAPALELPSRWRLAGRRFDGYDELRRAPEAR